MPRVLVDSHCHLDFEHFDADREQVIASARSAHVEKIIVPGTRRKYWARITQLCQRENLYACYGLHPYWVNQHTQQDLLELKTVLDENDCVAVGECGLDYRPGQADKSAQRDYFAAQLALATETGLPVVIHAVRATEDVIQTLKNFPQLRGMIHSYSGSLEQAKQLIDRGFYLSIGGAVTYDHAAKLQRVARHIPLTALLLETDAPDQPDSRHKNARNEPAYLVNTLEAIASLREETADEIAAVTTLNAEKLFGI